MLDFNHVVIFCPPMTKRGRKIPEGEDREARDVQISIYVTQEEKERLERAAAYLGFRSKSALIAQIIEPLAAGGFSGWAFIKLGSRFAKLITDTKKSEKSRWNFSGFDFFKQFKAKEIEDNLTK